MNRVSNDLISREYLLNLNCAEYDDNWRLIIPYETVENAPTAFDKEKVIEELENYLFEKYCVEGDEKVAEIVEKGGIE